MMESGYGNIVYPTQDISNIDGILPEAAKGLERPPLERDTIIASTLATDQIIDEFGQPANAPVPVPLPVDNESLTDDLQPLQSSELQPLDSVLVAQEAQLVVAADVIEASPIDEVPVVPEAPEASEASDEIEPVSDIAQAEVEPLASLEAAEQIDATNANEQISEHDIKPEGEEEKIETKEELGDEQEEEEDENEINADEAGGVKKEVEDDGEDAGVKSDKLALVVELEQLVLPEGTVTEEASTDEVKREIKKEEVIDQSQCRICLSKENLVNIFKYDHAKSLRICDLIMILCSPMKITERDYLPHFVCSPCVEKLNIAHDLKLQCEQTDKDLRSKLKRSTKKKRGPTEFLIIDCAEYSTGSDDDKNKDDDEFHLSELSIASDDIDSDVSFGKPKKRGPKPKGKRGRQPKAKTPAKTPAKTSSRMGKRKAATPVAKTPPSNKRTRNDIVYIEAPADSEEEEDEELKPRRRTRGPPPTPKGKKRGRKSKREQRVSSSDADDSDNETLANRRAGPASKRPELKCTYCSKSFASLDELREHKRIHVGEKPFACPICQKPFKQQVSLTAHIQKHKEEDDELSCSQCGQRYSSKIELRKHMQTVHAEAYTCDKCKRTFTTKPRLDKHKDGKCPGDTTVKKKNDYDYNVNAGRDLFKTVAPLTTTYWSDSFSD